MRRVYVFICTLLIVGCSNLKWNNPENIIKNRNRLQTGDILIKEKMLKDPTSWFGHASVMVNDYRVGDFPRPGKKYFTVTVRPWLKENGRKVIVLRYKKFTPKFKKQFLENIKKYGKGNYEISLNKYAKNNFYCSRFVWFLYYITAKDLGYELDLDSDGGPLILPYDFFGSKELEKIPF